MLCLLGVGLLVLRTAQAGSVVTHVTDPLGAPLPNAVLSLHLHSASHDKPTQVATMDQINKQYVPHVLPIQVGTWVSFPNHDDVRHHVYSFSDAKHFELHLYHGTQADSVLFNQAGIVVLGCNIHDSMLGYIYVVDTPYFARSNAEGYIELTDVPPGDYELRLWHPRLAMESPWLTRQVSVLADQTLKLSLQLPAWKPDPRTVEHRTELEALFLLPELDDYGP